MSLQPLTCGHCFWNTNQKYFYSFYFKNTYPQTRIEISNQLSCSAHRTTNFTNSEFQFPNLRCCKVFLFFVCKELYWHFLMYLGLNQNLLSCQYLVTK